MRETECGADLSKSKFGGDLKCDATNGVMRRGGENSLGIPAGRRSGVGEWCFLNPI